jgi:POT family proton-dependent oligopeptide transporter
MARTEYRTAPLKTDRMPPGIGYIVGSEAAERFSYYGMNAILVPFMTHHLMTAGGAPDLMKPAQAEAWYHGFTACAYFLPVLGAFLADAFLGKYRTILILSVVYCFGHFALALNDTRLGLLIGLGLVALGTGGIKPCVSANVGDQFGPANQHLLPRVFSWFYFSINAGAILSTLLVPWLLDAWQAPPGLAARWPAWVISCLEKCHGPRIAFGLPGIFMVIATLIFWLGRKKFTHIPPAGLRDFARQFLQPEYRTALRNLLVLMPFAAVFWSLWNQNFSSWVVQAEKMNRHLFGIDWLPAQIQTVNPIFILAMLPLFSYAVYPLVSRVFPLTPLRKIGCGLFLTALAFGIVGWIQTRIDAGAAPNILWQILAFVVLTAAEVMVSVTHLEFAYTQAPRKMKSLVMCTYLGSISLGNLFAAVVNVLIQNPDGSSKLTGAAYFFFFVKVMLAAAVAFVFVARGYRGRTYIQDEAAP